MFTGMWLLVLFPLLLPVLLLALPLLLETRVLLGPLFLLLLLLKTLINDPVREVPDIREFPEITEWPPSTIVRSVIGFYASDSLSLSAIFWKRDASLLQFRISNPSDIYAN